jgi:guanyl-specific ribonuclease Sa
MNAKKLFLGLLTATVVIIPFATLKPASAELTRRNSTGAIQQTISKDRLSPAAKATINNPNVPQKQNGKKLYKQDGKTFKNKEQKLPKDNKFTEHTVPPQGNSNNRGAERIVKDKTTGNQYHTKDHYKNFKKVTELNRRNSH